MGIELIDSIHTGYLYNIWDTVVSHHDRCMQKSDDFAQLKWMLAPLTSHYAGIMLRIKWACGKPKDQPGSWSIP